MFGNFQQKTVVRKVTVTVPAKPQPKPLHKTSSTTGISPAPSKRPPEQPSNSASANRGGSSSSTSKPKSQARPDSQRANGSEKEHRTPGSTSLFKRAVKRKASTPPPQWDDTDSSDSDVGAGSSDISSTLDYSARKRIRSSASSVDPGRQLVDRAAFAEEVARDVEKKSAPADEFALAHGADLVSGENAFHFVPAFREEVATLVELQYPSRMGRERFYLADSTESDGYKSMEDISETVKYVVANYLDARDRDTYGDEGTGIERRLIRALNSGDLGAYTKTISEYNTLIRQRVEDGSVQRTLGHKHAVDFNWMKRILDQVYSRTVSPHVEMLREYKNGTDNVYGELLYPLVSEMFRETGLRSDQIFVDLGSGVGNVVLQAALEIGCQSWGCEMMPNPCDLADLQSEEFPQRAKMWGLSVGKVHLLRGDFLENKAIGDVLRRADVVLVNNQAFGPDLNSKLVDRFLDLKDGCQVVSLKSFKPEGFEIQERNVNDVRHLLRVRKLEYFSNRVSWTDAPGNYFIATKDPSDLIRFQSGLMKRTSRR